MYKLITCEYSKLCRSSLIGVLHGVTTTPNPDRVLYHHELFVHHGDILRTLLQLRGLSLLALDVVIVDL